MNEKALMRWVGGILTTLVLAGIFRLFTVSQDVAVLLDRASSVNSRLDGHDQELRRLR